MTARSDRSPRRRQLARLTIALPWGSALSKELMRCHRAFEPVAVSVNGATERYVILESSASVWGDLDDLRASFELEERHE